MEAERRTVSAVIRRPPVLRRRHQGEDVALQFIEIECRKCCAVAFSHNNCARINRLQRLQVQLIRPPALLRGRPLRVHRAATDLLGAMLRRRRGLPSERRPAACHDTWWSGSRTGEQNTGVKKVGIGLGFLRFGL